MNFNSLIRLEQLEEMKRVMNERNLPVVPYVFLPEDLPRLTEEAEQVLRRWLDERPNRR